MITGCRSKEQTWSSIWLNLTGMNRIYLRSVALFVVP
jgi:hypothetical protein